MATSKRMVDDEEMLVPQSSAPHMQQPYVSLPETQQPYAGAAVTMPPAYSSPQQPYPQGSVPLGVMPGGVSHSTTTVIVNQPQAPVVTGPRIWSSNLCDCCDDMGSCLMGTFCPWILACQLSMDMGEHCCVPCCVPGWLVVLRTKMRADNNIQGTVMDDCCTICCCGHCVMCQMARELKHVRRVYQPSGI